MAHWALVIGVNYYPQDSRDKNLHGAVNDACCMKQYLETVIKKDLNIVLLTASAPLIQGNPPIEKEDSWPSFTKITSHLERIGDSAKPEDRVYVYYAGHGTVISSESALYVLSEDGRGEGYVRLNGVYKRLEPMVAKGVRVTLILDCCYSGGLIRGRLHPDIKMRYLEYNTTVCPELTQKDEAAYELAIDASRDASIEDVWLHGTEGLMVLTACSPEERSYEMLSNGTYQGIFTHFLLYNLNSLASNGLNITHHAIHDHLRTSFYGHWSRQTPMRYGKNGFALFGESLLAPHGISVPVYRNSGGKLCLRAGELHGVCEGDEYLARPRESNDTAPRSYEQAEIANLKVQEVRSVESELVLINSYPDGQITTEWKAKPLTSLSPRKIQVVVPFDLMDYSRSSISSELRYARSVPRDANGAQEGAPSEYYVAVNTENEYEIMDVSLERVFLSPAVPRSANGASQTIMRILKHLAEFRYFQGIDNRVPCPDLRTSLIINIENATKESSSIDVKHNDEVTFVLKSGYRRPLYVAIFNFRPSWEVKALTQNRGFKIIQPGKELRVSIRMQVPQFVRDMGVASCEDLFKFFVATRATHFQPSLPDIFQVIHNEDNQRGRGEDLSTFLGELKGAFRADSDDKWVTRSFVLHTSINTPD